MSESNRIERTGIKAWPRLLVGLLVLGIVLSVLIWFRDDLQLASLARHEQALRQIQWERPVLTLAIAFAVYVFVTGFSIPAATALSLLYAWYFGYWRAVVLISFSSTLGATVAFLISRFLLRDVMEARFALQLAKFNRSLERDGAFYLLSLRLLPVVPFFVVNAVMGLTAIRVRTFWWASQLGMLPGTLVYAYAGSRAPDLRTLSEEGVQGLPWLEIMVALSLLGLLPWVVRWLLSFRTRSATLEP